MAKTLKEVYSEILASEEKKAEFASLRTLDEVTAYAKKLGADASGEEITAFIKEMKNSELSDTDLEQVAGGVDKNVMPNYYSAYCY